MGYKVLWIEDGAFVEISDVAGPVINNATTYDLHVAFNVADAVKKIQVSQFDAVIVDIRIPPGFDSEWENLYKKSGYNRINARLGINLLFSLLKPRDAAIKLKNIPRWISPEKFGIFTVEGKQEVKDDLEKLGIQFFEQKRAGIPNTILLGLIEKIINNQKKFQHRRT
ncbi:MAG: hypothetical protein NT166_06060 [Candidatus Aminicenantes bacterium]|nr:hypothetical protein [Candidatus Aminicenantes bacterium]